MPPFVVISMAAGLSKIIVPAGFRVTDPVPVFHGLLRVKLPADWVETVKLPFPVAWSIPTEPKLRFPKPSNQTPPGALITSTSFCPDGN